MAAQILITIQTEKYYKHLNWVSKEGPIYQCLALEDEPRGQKYSGSRSRVTRKGS